MSKMCPYCKALKFNGETMGMCCASGKVKLPQPAAPPEPLKTLRRYRPGHQETMNVNDD